jgi:hypothetical protein
MAHLQRSATASTLGNYPLKASNMLSSYNFAYADCIIV